MKKLFLLLLVCIIVSDRSWCQIFTQDFSASTVVSDYYADPPSANQFSSIATNAGATVEINSNSLKISCNSSGKATVTRNVNFNPVPSGIKFQFDFSMSGNSVSSISGIFIVYIGGGSLIDGTTLPGLSEVYARISFIPTATDGQFKMRDLKSSTSGSHTYSSPQTITWFLNNTGSTQSYVSPNSTLESLENDKADIWVGTIREFANMAVETPTQTLAKFKFGTNNPDDGINFVIDNIIVNNESALPVELTSFTGSVLNNSVRLNWETATEVNNYGFNVERASTTFGSSWERVGFVQGHGNSNSPKSYSFTDNLALARDLNLTSAGGYLQYRLKQIDFDGAFEYSPVVKVSVDGPVVTELRQNFPNPFNPSTTISYSIPNVETLGSSRTSLHHVILKVFDMLGREVAVLVNGLQQAGNYNIPFSGEKLCSGIYHYKLSTDNFVSVKKMLLIK